MKLDELYAKYDEAVGKLNVSPIDHFVFNLADENSQNSLKVAFPGIESMLMPESGKYLVVSPIVENQDILVLMFPQKSDGSLGLWAFNTKSKKGCELTSGNEGEKPTLENFSDFANMEEITRRFNEFAFMAGGEDSCTTEVKDIGSFDVSNDEPVEIPNNTDNEETKMTFKPIQEESLDSELKETKWVEIPNTTAHGVTVTEDEGAGGEDPFADGSLDANAPAPEGDAAAAPADGGEAAPADAPVDGGEAAPADGGEAAPADGGEAAPADAPATEPPALDDPKAKMRELLAYYTNYMNELVQDPNTSTELISATQEMIDSLIKNMESADGIEEVKADSEEAAKEDVAVDEAPAEETPPAEGDAAAAPAEGEGEAAPAEEPVAETTQENPVTDIPIQEETQDNPITDIPIQENVDEEQKAIDDKIDAEVDELHKDDWENIEPATSDNILTPGDIQNSVVNDVDLSGVVPTPDEEIAAATPDETVQPTSDVLDDTALPTPDEEDALFDDGADDFSVGADGLPLDTFEGDIDALGAAPCAKKIQWSSDYATNGVATTDDNSVVVPGVLNELSDYYKKVADEVSKVPGKEDVAMKLQKIQILTQTIQTEWNGIVSQIGDVSADSYDRSLMGDLEKDELDQAPAMDMVGADVMADQEAEEEDDLKINNDIAAFCESFKHLL